MPDTTRRAAERVQRALDGLSRPRTREEGPNLAPLPGTPLLRLQQLANLAREIEDLAAEEVQRSLDQGETWEAIGEAVSLTRQGAHRRWAKRLRAQRLL